MQRFLFPSKPAVILISLFVWQGCSPSNGIRNAPTFRGDRLCCSSSLCHGAQTAKGHCKLPLYGGTCAEATAQFKIIKTWITYSHRLLALHCCFCTPPLLSGDGDFAFGLRPSEYLQSKLNWKRGAGTQVGSGSVGMQNACSYCQQPWYRNGMQLWVAYKKSSSWSTAGWFGLSGYASYCWQQPWYGNGAVVGMMKVLSLKSKLKRIYSRLVLVHYLSQWVCENSRSYWQKAAFGMASKIGTQNAFWSLSNHDTTVIVTKVAGSLMHF